MHPFARVSVNMPQISGLFDYRVPQELQSEIVAGALVIVPFNAQRVQGIVVSFPVEPSVPELKSIELILESKAVVNTNQINLSEWMSREFLTSQAAALDLMLPAGLSQQADTLYHLVEPGPRTNLPPTQLRVVDVLIKRGDLRGRQLDAALPKVNWRASAGALLKNGLLQSRPVLPPPSVRPKTIRTAQFLKNVDLSIDPGTLGRKDTQVSIRRKHVLDFLEREAIPIGVTWVYAETDAKLADLTTLAEQGLIQLGETQIWRDPLKNFVPVFTKAPQLTPEQTNVMTIIHQQLTGQMPIKPNLIQGVTGSGKTEIYLQAVEETLSMGKQAIILVPEISLTPQTVRRFFARFPGKIGLLHSRLSPGERYDTWHRIRNGDLPIVIGPRSALFAPLNKIGLIVIDECHDGSYHQEETPPRYNSVDTAIEYAALCGAVLILGSATPEIETLYEFQRNKWPIHQLPNRVVGAHHSSLAETPAEVNYLPMPEIKVIDMRAELVAGNRSALSRVLHSGIADVLARNEQAILFLNRRGSASYVFCRDCGTVVKCPRCNTPLTYHADESALICHICNYRRLMPKKCPACGSTNIRQFGMGTQSLEKLIVEQFPAANVLRWDADTTKVKGAHDLILEHFSAHRADILIGTQMLAKGLDLPMVTLVGVILADVSIHLPDFRAGERTFQILTQVAGRAGRSERGGQVILQTFEPEHYAIQKAASYDFEGFQKQELEYRSKTGYPPYSRMVKLEFRDLNAGRAEETATKAGEYLAELIKDKGMTTTDLIGPVPCFYQRKAGFYRWQILLRGPKPKVLLQEHPISGWPIRGVSIDVTTDPIDLL
jgi:primosomal protein N' (replication factor Y) (superfamily II helicase)